MTSKDFSYLDDLDEFLIHGAHTMSQERLISEQSFLWWYKGSYILLEITLLLTDSWAEVFTSAVVIVFISTQLLRTEQHTLLGNSIVRAQPYLPVLYK